MDVFTNKPTNILIPNTDSFCIDSVITKSSPCGGPLTRKFKTATKELFQQISPQSGWVEFRMSGGKSGRARSLSQEEYEGTHTLPSTPFESPSSSRSNSFSEDSPVTKSVIALDKFKWLEASETGRNSFSKNNYSESLHDLIRKLKPCSNSISDSNAGVIGLYIKSFPTAVEDRDLDGKLPLHVSVESFCPNPFVVQLLIKEYPIGVRICDNNVRLLKFFSCIILYLYYFV